MTKKKDRNRKTLQEFGNSALRKLSKSDDEPEVAKADGLEVDESPGRISVTGVDTNNDGVMDAIEVAIPRDDTTIPESTHETRSAHEHTPMVEIEIVHQRTTPTGNTGPYQTVEVSTQNRIYIMDPAMICVKVIDRKSEKEQPDHSFIGARLVGGQHRDGMEIELSYPYPRPGTEAVFEHTNGKRASFSRSSTVSRVLLRLHVVTVSAQNIVPTWAQVSGTLPGH